MDSPRDLFPVGIWFYWTCLIVGLLFASVFTHSALADSLRQQSATSGDSKQDVQIIVSTDKSEYASGDPVLVHVTIQNRGRVLITHFAKRYITPRDLIVVRTENGVTTKYQDVPTQMTDYARFVTNVMDPRTSASDELDPGYQESYTFLLNLCRDITMSGPYKITLVYKIFPNDDSDKAYLLSSNTANISVTFAPAQGVSARLAFSKIDASTKK